MNVEARTEIRKQLRSIQVRLDNAVLQLDPEREYREMKERMQDLNSIIHVMDSDHVAQAYIGFAIGVSDVDSKVEFLHHAIASLEATYERRRQ